MSLDRRRVLALGVAMTAGGVVTACSSPESQTQTPEPERNPLANPDRELIALYAAVRRTYPALDGPLREFEDQHVAHLAALGGDDIVDEVDISVAVTSAGAIEQCMLAERRAADSHQDACLRSADAVEVRLLTLIAASEASHVPALERLL